jgi:hypothetical protein
MMDKPDIFSTAVIDNVATVNGRGLPGFTAILFCDGLECGSVLIGADGLFSVPSTFRRSGTTRLSVTQMDSAGRESDSSTASPAVILQPPTVTSIEAQGRTAVIVGRGDPGATITVKDKTNATVGTTIVATDGTWTLTVPDLAVGTHPFTATQRNTAGVSDIMDAGSVIISPNSIASPIVTATDALSGKGRVRGTGVAGFTIQLLDSKDVEIGTAIVASDGTFVVVSVNDLPSGTNPLKIRQISPAGATSGIVSAGNVVIPPIVTSSALSGGKGLVSGTGKPGANITLYSGTNVVGSGVVDA